MWPTILVNIRKYLHQKELHHLTKFLKIPDVASNFSTRFSSNFNGIFPFPTGLFFTPFFSPQKQKKRCFVNKNQRVVTHQRVAGDLAGMLQKSLGGWIQKLGKNSAEVKGFFNHSQGWCRIPVSTRMMNYNPFLVGESLIKPFYLWRLHPVLGGNST